ncbi:MAG: DUF58 domain-containing protein [Planctomycetales bacterium]
METNTSQYLDPETVARLQGLDLKARSIVEGYVAGRHKSPFHGFSVEFAEHREYVSGDDLRYVDWKIFGRSDRIYLKQYEEETNFACYMLVDSSESMKYQSASAPVSKLEYARWIAAALSFLVLQQQDAVGLATYDNTVRQFLKALSYPSHFQQICHVLEQAQPERDSQMGPIFHEMAERVRKRGLVLILSDCFDDVSSILTGLKHLRHRRHEVILMQVIDPAEQDFPFRDPTLFKGLEMTREEMVDPHSLRRAYQAEFEQFLKELRGGCREMRIEHVLIRTDASLSGALSAFLAGRLQRGRGG